MTILYYVIVTWISRLLFFFYLNVTVESVESLTVEKVKERLNKISRLGKFILTFRIFAEIIIIGVIGLIFGYIGTSSFETAHQLLSKKETDGLYAGLILSFIVGFIGIKGSMEKLVSRSLANWANQVSTSDKRLQDIAEKAPVEERQNETSRNLE